MALGVIGVSRLRLVHRFGEYNAVEKRPYRAGLAAVDDRLRYCAVEPDAEHPLEGVFGGARGRRLVHVCVMAKIGSAERSYAGMTWQRCTRGR